jgi:hypothetical protein
MDNVEAYGGLVAAAELAAALKDDTLKSRALADAQRERAGIDSLWNAETGAYDWAVHENGEVRHTDWSNFYPDSVEQAWVVAYGAADPARASALLAQFAVSQPNWDHPRATAQYWDGAPYEHEVGYWPLIGWAFLRMGATETARAGAQSIRSAAVEAGRSWPFTTGDAGQLVNLELGVGGS